MLGRIHNDSPLFALMVEAGEARRHVVPLGAAHCGPGHDQFAGQSPAPNSGDLARAT